MTTRIRRLHVKLLSGVAAVALSATAALADGALLSLPEQPLAQSLKDIARATGVNILFTPDAVADIKARALKGQMTARIAVNALLAGTNLQVVPDDSGGLIVRRQLAANDSSAPAASTKKTDQSEAPAPTNENGEGAEEKETEKDESKVEKVVVTGSRIRGNTDSASPLDIYRREDIDRSGAATTDQFVETIPQNFGGGASQDTANSSPDAATLSNRTQGATINLRGLGAGTTLVLLNGRRLAPAGNLGAFVDVSMIPLSAVERIEVLSDGASAIYGSDAVGGVVNFILRDEVGPAETRVRVGSDSEGGAQELRVGQSAGVDWDGGSALGAIEYYEREALLARDRGFTKSPANSPGTLLPDSNRTSAFLSVRHDVTDALEVYALGLHSERESDSTTFSATSLVLGELDSESEDLFASFGGRLTLGDWALDLSAAHSTSDESFKSATLNSTTPASFGVIDSETASYDLIADGPLFGLPAGDVQLAAGVSYRAEEIESTLRRGSTLVLRDFGSRDVSALFAELLVPVTDDAGILSNLELSLAGRYDEYSDFGESFVPKVGVRFEPFEGMSLRSTFGKSFRAPRLVQLSERRSLLLVNVPDPASSDGTSLTLFEGGAGNRNLTAENSESWTAGFDYRPSATLRLSGTYYEISYQDRIATPTANIFGILPNAAVFQSIITRNPGAAFVNGAIANSPSFINFFGPFDAADVEVYVDARVRNLSAEEQSGLDLSASANFEDDLDSFSLSGSLSYIFNYDRRLTSTSAEVSQINVLYSPIDLRARFQANWTHEDWGSTLTYNFADSYADNSVTPFRKIDSWQTWDLQLRYGTQQGRGVGVALSVTNLFDEEPPRIASAPAGVRNIGYDPTNADPMGRFVSLEVVTRW